MYFEHSIQTTLPVDVVYETLRDDLVNLVDYLPNVKKIEVLERKKTKNSIKMLNKWYGKYQLPMLVNKMLHIDELAWLDRAEWMNSGYECNWSFEPLIFKEYIDVHGKNSYLSAGKHTTMKITGDINIDFGNHPLVPSMFRNKINNEITKIAIALIKPNFAKLVKGLEGYIKSK